VTHPPRAASAALCWIVLLVAALASPAVAGAAAGAQQRAASRQLLADVVSGPGITSTKARFAALDNRGKSLDTIKVIQVGARYIGIYHSAGNGRYDVDLGTSTDLMNWTYVTTLDTDATHATIRELPGGAFLVAYEKYLLGDLFDRPLLTTQLDPLYNPLNRIQLRFRYYPSIDALLAGTFSRQFTAKRKLSKISEGTPNIIGARLAGGKLSHSRIRVGLHYLKSLRHRPDSDRQGVGELRDFKKWRPVAQPKLDRRILKTKLLHTGFTSPPTGSVGDRDDILLNGVSLRLQEAEYVPRDWSTWRIFLVDPKRASPVPIEIKTPKGSTSFAAPTVTQLTAPDGRPALFVSIFVLTEGADPHEAGQLIYYKEL
jgi:hypothetical protein